MNPTPPETRSLLGSPDDDTVAAQPAPRGSALATRPIPDDAVALVPLRNMVLFPGVIAPVTIGRQRSVLAAQQAAKDERRVGFVLQRDPRQDAPAPEDLHRVGTAGQVLRYVASAEGAHHLVVQGQARFRVLEFLEGWPYRVARVSWIDEPEWNEAARTPELEARFLQLKGMAIEAIELLPQAPAELAEVVRAAESPASLADMVANLLDITAAEKQDLLEAFGLEARLDRVLALLGQRVEVLRLSKNIGDQTRKAFDSRQREHVLR
ncbi:MAG TPA: LON peptidase substrate-binding domain-containing protein, partial [Burkholderiales bacterium]